MSNPRICITSGGDEIRNRSYVNHAIYAREHGFSHHLGIGLAPGITSPYYYKFEVILEVLPFYDWTVWLDDDVYLTDLLPPTLENLIAEAEAADVFLIIAEGPEEPDGTWTHINTGVFALRNDPRAFTLLERAKAMDLDELKTRWVDEEDGLWTNGDQDTTWNAIRSDEALREGTRIVSHRLLNSRPHYYDSALTDAFAVHFAGPGDKTMKTAAFGRRFGLGQELVPTYFLDKWSVKRRQTMTQGEILARQARWRGHLALRRIRRKIDWVRTTGRWK